MAILMLGACSSSENSLEIAQANSQTPNAAGNPQIAASGVSCSANAADMQRAMLQSFNATRASARACGAQNFAAATPLSWNNQLETAARNHSVDMVSNNFFNHTGSDGLSAADRVSASGYDWSHVGENLAGGQATVEEAVQAWIGSDGHCANLMNPDFLEVAVACQSSPGSSLQSYWTAVFATAR